MVDAAAAALAALLGRHSLGAPGPDDAAPTAAAARHASDHAGLRAVR